MTLDGSVKEHLWKIAPFQIFMANWHVTNNKWSKSALTGSPAANKSDVNAKPDLKL